MISDSKRKLQIPKIFKDNSVITVRKARNRAKKEKSISGMALVFRAGFSTWKEAENALDLPTGLLYAIASGRVTDSPKFRIAMGLMPKPDTRHHFRLRLSDERLYRLITDDAAWAAHREELRREYEKRVQP